MKKNLFKCLVLTIWLLAACAPQLASTPSPSNGIIFAVERATLRAGECTTLRWEVTEGFGVTLDGQPVDMTGQMEVCPTEARTYNLRVDMGTHIETRQVEIAVGGAGLEPGPGPTEPAVPAYQAESWLYLGGPPGGLGYDIRMRPDNPDIMFVTDAAGGIFKSMNGGASWFPVNPTGYIDPSTGIGIPAFCATIDPHNPDIVWVGTQLSGHLYRSPDGGQTWERRDNGILNTTEDLRSLRGITIDPNDQNTMYLGVEVRLIRTSLERQAGWKGTTAGEVYKSTDGGQNWRRIWFGPSLARYVWVDPRKSNRIYVSTGIFDRDAANQDAEKHTWGGVGILRSDDGGQTWTVLNEQNGLGGVFIPSLFMHPENPDILLAAVTNPELTRGTDGMPVATRMDFPAQSTGVYVTYDGGDTWQRIIGESEPSMDAVEISTADPNVWYAATENVIYRSDNAGQTWQRFAMVTDERKSGMPIDLQVDPRDPYRIFVNNYGGGNMVSEDGGQTWRDASQGYTGAHVGGLAVDPLNSRSILVGTNTGTHYSQDGGVSWMASLGYRLESIAYLPQVEASMDTIVVGGDDRGRFYRSEDAGVTWGKPILVAGYPQDFMVLRALAIAPSNPQILYAGFTYYRCIGGDWRTCATPGLGFFFSQDGGSTWQELTNIPFADVTILSTAVDPQDALKVYVATAKGLYMTIDGGNTWLELNSLEAAALQYPPPSDIYPQTFLVFDVVIDPFDSETLYAATALAGVFRSTDGGVTWQQASAGMDPNEPIYDLEPDLNRQGVWYASSWFAGVFVTTDGAQSWRKLGNGLPPIPMREIVLSQDGSVLYAGTFGAGVWRLGTP